MNAVLGSLCQFVNGGTPAKSEARFFDGDIPWITSADITGPVVTSARSFITQEAIAASATNKVRAGTILLVTRTGVGKVALAGSDLCFSQDITAVIPDSKRVDPLFLIHFLRTKQDYFLSMARGATIKGITRDVVAGVEIPVPSLSEQRRIAAILDRADALRAKRRESMAQLYRLAEAIFLEMFGDPKFNPNAWRLRPIESVVLDMRGGAALEPEDFVARGFPILHKGAIKPGGQIETDPKKKAFAKQEYAMGRPKSIVDRDYVAVTLRDLVPSGPSIGLAADLRHAPQDRYLLAQGAYGIRLDPAQVHADYFVQLSNMPNFRHILRQHAVGSTQIHIRNPVYLSIRIPTPPLDLQLEFAKRMHLVRHQVSRAEGSMAAFNGLFGASQSRAFRGEL